MKNHTRYKKNQGGESSTTGSFSLEKFLIFV